MTISNRRLAIDGVAPRCDTRTVRVGLGPALRERQRGKGSVIDDPSETRNTAATLVAEAMACYERGDLEGVAAFVHPDAEIEMLFLGGEVARGPEGLIEALTQAREGVHRPTMTGVEPIGDDAAMMIGRIQHADQRGGLTDRKAVWLTIARDGLLWRTRIFDSEDEARAYHASLLGERPSDARA